MRALRLGLVALAAAVGGSATGAAFLLVPSVLFGAPADLWLFGGAVFFGAIFAAITASLWAALHCRFAVPDEAGGLGHG